MTQMNKSIRKVIENKTRGETDCQKVIGSTAKINRYGKFWEYEQDSLMVLSAANLIEYIEKNNPSTEELIAFKKGQAGIALFFGKCYEEKKRELPAEPLG